jgi:hydrogenase nickel incorporation protein HypA/HybF
MHELAIATDIIEACEEASAGATVRRVVLEIGRLSPVAPEAVRFCFELAGAGTVAEGATLEICQTDGEELRIRSMEVD